MMRNRVLNNCTYLWRPTLRGNIACTKRFAERVRIDIKFTMNRLTNPYNLMVGSEVPLVCSHNHTCVECFQLRSLGITGSTKTTSLK